MPFVLVVSLNQRLQKGNVSALAKKVSESADEVGGNLGMLSFDHQTWECPTLEELADVVQQCSEYNSAIL